MARYASLNRRLDYHLYPQGRSASEPSLIPNVKDSDGNIVFDYEYPTRFLNENGQQITHEVYTEMLNNGQPVYIACFVGCTYHCG